MSVQCVSDVSWLFPPTIDLLGLLVIYGCITIRTTMFPQIISTVTFYFPRFFVVLLLIFGPIILFLLIPPSFTCFHSVSSPFLTFSASFLFSNSVRSLSISYARAKKKKKKKRFIRIPNPQVTNNNCMPGTYNIHLVKNKIRRWAEQHHCINV